MTSQRTVGDTPANPQRNPRLRGPYRPLLMLGSLVLAMHLMLLGSAAAQDAESSPEASPAATPADDAIRLEIPFEERNDSGVSGTATLFINGEETIVEIELEGAGESHPAHVHEGTCDEMNPESAWDLENVEDGTSTSVIDVPLSDLLNGEYVIDLHLAPNQLGLLIGCATIEGTPSNAGGTPVAAGGENGSTDEPATEEVTTEPAATEAASTEAPATEAPATEDAATEAPDTEEATTPEATTEATTEAVEPTATESGDGTDVTPTGDGTDGGKGVPLTPTPTPVAVGGSSTSGDGTTGDQSGVGSGKGVPITSTSNLPAATGSGDSLLLPTSPTGALIWATGGFALVLFASGLMMRRGEHRQTTGRWKRLGL